MIDKILNLGPKSGLWLHRIGVTTMRELRKRGAARVYRELLRRGHPKNKNMWYALRAAELGIPWQRIARQENDRSTKSTSDEPPVRTKRIGGVVIKYWEYHQEHTATVFLWHGFRGSHRGLLAVAEQLQGYRVIIPDLPGWGDSDALPVAHTLTNTIRYLKKFLDSFHLKSYSLIGHSFGATLALMYAARHSKSIKQLILIQPVVNATSFTSRLGELYYATASRLPKTVRQRVIASPILNRGKSELLSVETNLQRRRRLMSNEQKNLIHVRDWVEIEMYRSLAKADYFAAMKSLTVPVTLVAGTQDRMTPTATTKKIVAVLPGHRIVTIPKAGHFVPMEKPEALAAVLNRLLGDEEQ